MNRIVGVGGGRVGCPLLVFQRLFGSSNAGLNMLTPSLGRLMGLAALVLFAAPFARGATPVISEFMAINERTLADEHGEYPDWIEIYNPGPGTLDLRDWALSDDPSRPLKWRFPAVSVVQNAYLVVFASQKNRINPAGKLHTNFKLSGDGEFLGLFDPQGEQVSGFSPVFPLQYPSVSYGLPQPTNPAVKHYFSQPTPGTANNTGFTEVAAEPTFSHPSGAYPTNFSLTLSAPGMTIRYTTNGANPTTTSTLYS